MNFFQQVGANTLARLTSIGRAALMLFGAIFAMPSLKNIPLTSRCLLLWCRVCLSAW